MTDGKDETSVCVADHRSWQPVFSQPLSYITYRQSAILFTSPTKSLYFWQHYTDRLSALIFHLDTWALLKHILIY